MKALRSTVVAVVATALVVGGWPASTTPSASAIVTTADIAWTSLGGGFESQQITRPLSMVGLTWEGDRPLTAWYRTNQDGRWSGWFPLPVEGAHEPDSGTAEAARTVPGSDPVWVGESDGIQFRMTGSNSRRANAVLIDTSNRRDPLFSQLTDFLTPRVPAASGAPSQPLIHPRSEWDPNNECPPRDEPDEVQITHFFVHHTTGSNNISQAQTPGYILGVCKFHRNSRGWDDIAYNFLIDRYGNIWEGRAGGIDKGIQGGHTKGFSTYSVGVAFIGTYSSSAPSAAAETALRSLIAWKANIHNVDMKTINTVVSKGSEKYDVGVPVALHPISGHRDAQATSCPGAACYNRLPTYRSRVNQLWSQVPLSTYTSPLVADFDGDGADEGAAFRTTDGNWLLTETNGSTATWADFSTAKGWSSQLVGDFDGDGRDDIANFHPSNGTWWVSRSTGSGFTTSLWADFTTASGWSSQLVGDFNGDGRDDIANFHPSNGTWWVSRSTGSGFTTSLWADFTTASGWTVQIAGDFNGDGRDDIANRHVGNGTWWTVLSAGGGFAPVRYWGVNTTRDHISHWWVQDIDGDGNDDILTVDAYNGFLDRHLSSGSVFSIEKIVDMPWRTTVGGDDRDRAAGTTGWLYFGQEFQWVRLSDLDVDIPDNVPEGSPTPEATTSIAVTLPRP